MAVFDQENRQTEKTLLQKARRLSRRNQRVFYLNAAILSVYGWQMAIPVLVGIVVGRLLDRYWPATYLSWTLNFILIGFIVGIVNATRWVRKEGLIKKGNPK